MRQVGKTPRETCVTFKSMYLIMTIKNMYAFLEGILTIVKINWNFLKMEMYSDNRRDSCLSCKSVHCHLKNVWFMCGHLNPIINKIGVTLGQLSNTLSNAYYCGLQEYPCILIMSGGSWPLFMFIKNIYILL